MEKSNYVISTHTISQVSGVHGRNWPLGILDLDMPMILGLKGDMQEDIKVSIWDVLMSFVVSWMKKPLFLMIDQTASGPHEGIYPTGAERNVATENIATHVASAVMYYLLFEKIVKLENVTTFLNTQLPSGCVLHLVLRLED